MSHPLFDIRGQVVLVTGAARGLGAALAEGFAEAGARVALCDLDESAAHGTVERIRVAGGHASSHACDVTDPKEVRAFVEAAASAHGPPDVLVNNAGINIPKPAEELSLDEWNRILQVNLTAAFSCCQVVGDKMLARGSGCIVNICSIHGHVGSYVHKAAAYNASKAGLINLTRSLALEWGDRGVRVNAISPGPMRTELMATRLANPDYVRKLTERTAIKRVGEPRDIVGAAVFLVSPAAAWITGQILAVDGGWLAA